MPAILITDGCNCRILATPPCKHAPFWLPSSQCSHPPADGCDGCVPAISARPHDGCHTAVAAIGRRMAVANSTQPSRRPDTSPGGSTLAPRATTPLFWMAGVVISQPSRWNAWSGYSKLSHPPADGCDGCMPAIMRPGGWPGHSHRSHRPEDGCADGNAAKMARVLGGGVARML